MRFGGIVPESAEGAYRRMAKAIAERPLGVGKFRYSCDSTDPPVHVRLLMEPPIAVEYLVRDEGCNVVLLNILPSEQVKDLA